MTIAEETAKTKVCPFMSRPGVTFAAPSTIKCLGSGCIAWEALWDNDKGQPMGRCRMVKS